MKLKAFTIENLEKDGACEEGMKFVRLLIEVGSSDHKIAEWLFEHRRDWFFLGGKAGL